MWYIFRRRSIQKGYENMKFAICDDEKICFESLQSTINTLGYAEEIQVEYYSTGEQLLRKLKDNKHFDLIFMDIYFADEVQGIKTSKAIREFDTNVPICFLTTSEEYVFDGYDVQALQYLIKPIDKTKVLKIIHRIKEQTQKNYCVINSNYEVHRILKEDILFLESSKRQLIIHLNNSSEITIYAKLRDFAKEHLEKKFVQCHQSFIVNMEYIDDISSDHIYLLRGQEIVPISRRFKKSVLENFKRYMFEEN